MENKTSADKKQSYDELESSTQGLLRRLSNRYDSGRVEAEKSVMKSLDGMDEPEENAPDVVAFDTTTDLVSVAKGMSSKKAENRETANKAADSFAAQMQNMLGDKKTTADKTSVTELKIAFDEKPAKTAPEMANDDGKISEKELQNLFDKYLGSEEENTAAEEKPASYDSIHQQILDAEEKSGVSPAPKTDVKKNIDEAEKYVYELAAKTGENERVKTGEYPRAATDSAEVLAAYEPAAAKEAHGQEMPDRIYHTKENTKETLAAPEPVTDTAMMKAFGLDPHKNITKDERLFSEYSLSDTTDIQSTEEITLRELDEDAVEPANRTEMPSADFEYKDSEQNKHIFSIFKAKYNASKLKIVAAVVLSVFLFLLENFTVVSDLLGTKINVIAVDWLLSFACVALVLDRVINAARNIGKFRFDGDSVILLGFLFSLVATLTAIFVAYSYEAVTLYNFPLALCTLMSVIGSFISLRRDVYSFKIVSSGKIKRVISRLDAGTALATPEYENFSTYLGTDSDICEVKKADFISDFFARRKEYNRAKSPLRILIPICFGISAIFFFLSYYIAEQTVAESFGTTYAVFMMCAPFAAFLSYSYPMYLASRRAFAYNAAVLGDNTPDDYKNTSVIAFRDEDAFPAGKIKVKSIKIYAERNIENVIYYASSVYSKLGGPLATVFKQATLNSMNSENVELREVSAEGVSAVVDGKNIVIGRPAYMESQCFETMPESGDGECEGKSNKRILYLACDQVVIAKFYVQYNTTSDFIYIVRHLADAGVCVSIRTNDPALDTEVLTDNKMDPYRYPVRVVKGMLSEEKAETISAQESGVVSVGSSKDLVKTMLLCDRLRNVTRTNLVLKIVAAALGVAVMALLLFTGKAVEMRSMFPALYQMFWLLPLLFVSKIYI